MSRRKLKAKRRTRKYNRVPDADCSDSSIKCAVDRVCTPPPPPPRPLAQGWVYAPYIPLIDTGDIIVPVRRAHSVRTVMEQWSKEVDERLYKTETIHGPE